MQVRNGRSHFQSSSLISDLHQESPALAASQSTGTQGWVLSEVMSVNETYEAAVNSGSALLVRNKIERQKDVFIHIDFDKNVSESTPQIHRPEELK